MKNYWRLAVWASVFGVTGLAFYLLWRDSCGCSMVRFSTFVQWLGPSIIFSAIDGAFIGLGIQAMFALTSRSRIKPWEGVCLGFVLGVGLHCSVSMAATGARNERWWVRRFQRAPEGEIRLTLTEIKILSDRNRRGNYQTDQQAWKKATADLLALIRSGVDGCYLVHSLGSLDRFDEDVVAGLLGEAMLTSWENDQIDTLHREMNGLWHLAPSDPRVYFHKRMNEFRFLADYRVQQRSDAAGKVPYGAWSGEKFTQARPEGDRRAFFGQHDENEVRDLVNDRELMAKTMATLKLMYARDQDLDHPRFVTQLFGAGSAAQVTHYAQRHPSFFTENTPTDVAIVAAYQLAILRELQRLSPSHVINEKEIILTSPTTLITKPEEIFREHLYASFAEAPPVSIRDLTPDQIACLNVAGAAGIYHALNWGKVTLWNALSEEETVYQLDLTRKRSEATSHLDNQFFGDDVHFSQALKSFETASWNDQEFLTLYREQRVAELKGRIIRQDPATRVAIIFGALHDLQPAFSRMQRRTHLGFSLRRASWMERGWYEGARADPLATPVMQLSFILRLEKVGPEDLSLFTDEGALQVAVGKMFLSQSSPSDDQAERMRLRRRLAETAKVDYRTCILIRLT